MSVNRLINCDRDSENWKFQSNIKRNVLPSLIKIIDISSRTHETCPCNVLINTSTKKTF